MDKKIIKVELPEVANKLLDKPATTLGEKLSDLLEIIFGNITYKKQEIDLKRQMNFEKFKDSLCKKIGTIETNDKVEPNEGIIGTSLEAVKYRLDEEMIREMFANLIASSMNKTTYEKVHPAFVEILKNLSSDDVKAIIKLVTKIKFYIIPIISFKKEIMIIPDKIRYYCDLIEDFGLERSNIVIYSLLRNGLVQINNFNVRESELCDFTNLEKEYLPIDKTGINPEDNYDYGVLSLTAFGWSFAEICCPDTIDDILKTREKNNIK